MPPVRTALTPHRTALVLLLAAATGCAPYERPEVVLTNVTPLESTLFEQRVRLDLRIRNPNDRDLEVRGIDLRLDVNGVRLARGLSGESLSVPRFGEAEASLVASTSIFDLLRQGLVLVEEPRVDYAIAGRVLLAGGLFAPRLTFEHAGTLVDEDFLRIGGPDALRQPGAWDPAGSSPRLVPSAPAPPPLTAPADEPLPDVR